MRCMGIFRVFLLSFFCCMAIGVFAQKPQNDATILVKVSIVDSDKNPLPGATVKVTGKAQVVI